MFLLILQSGNVFLNIIIKLHFITYLSITKFIIIIINIISSISFIIILVYTIDFFHKSKGQSLKLHKYKLSYKVILQNYFRKLSFLKNN
jgi:hypothetical protein